MVRAVFLHERDLPRDWLEERRRRGLDRRDEVWDGVLHIVPAPTLLHQQILMDLAIALRPVADRHGLRVTHDSNHRDPVLGWKDFRIPDLSIFDPKYAVDTGIDGRAEVVIEILSPDDESRDKFPFYARQGMPEIWLIDPDTREVEVHALVERDVRVAARDGVVVSPRLGIELETVAGPKLQIRDGDRIANV